MDPGLSSTVSGANPEGPIEKLVNKSNQFPEWMFLDIIYIIYIYNVYIYNHVYINFSWILFTYMIHRSRVFGHCRPQPRRMSKSMLSQLLLFSGVEDSNGMLLPDFCPRSLPKTVQPEDVTYVLSISFNSEFGYTLKLSFSVKNVIHMCICI